MNSIDLSPLYRSSIGYDRLGSLIDSALRASDHAPGYPPYNIEVVDDDNYVITLAVAGFERSDLDVAVENNVLTVSGRRGGDAGDRRFLHQGIANRSFERRFTLAEYVEVNGADLNNGLLTVTLRREVPEAMKPRTIPIEEPTGVLEHATDDNDSQAAPREAA